MSEQKDVMPARLVREDEDNRQYHQARPRCCGLPDGRFAHRGSWVVRAHLSPRSGHLVRAIAQQLGNPAASFAIGERKARSRREAARLACSSKAAVQQRRPSVRGIGPPVSRAGRRCRRCARCGAAHTAGRAARRARRWSRRALFVSTAAIPRPATAASTVEPLQ